MKLNIGAVVIAEIIAVAIAFALCALVVAAAPDLAASFTRYALHIDLAGISRQVSWGGFFTGLISISVFLGGVAAIWAWLYNLIAGGRQAR